jgi:hypothetical protein
MPAIAKVYFGTLSLSEDMAKRTFEDVAGACRPLRFAGENPLPSFPRQRTVTC